MSEQLVMFGESEYVVTGPDKRTYAMVPVISLRMARETTVEWDIWPRVDNPEKAAVILAPIVGSRDRETLVALHLDTQKHPLAIEVVAVGGLAGAQLRIGDMFKGALLSNAQSIVLAHNHPSGDPAPSPEDIIFTENVRRAGDLLDIPLVDHLVIGGGGSFISLAERGLMKGGGRLR